MRNATEIKQVVQQSQLEQRFAEQVTAVRDTVSHAVYPGLKKLTALIAEISTKTQTGGEFESFASNPLTQLFNDITAGNELTELTEALAAIEALERETTPAGETNGLFELNLPPAT